MKNTHPWNSVFYGDAEMAKNQQPDNKERTRWPNGRPIIGFLAGFHGQFFHPM
jgi:hypothetical protein